MFFLFWVVQLIVANKWQTKQDWIQDWLSKDYLDVKGANISPSVSPSRQQPYFHPTHSATSPLREQRQRLRHGKTMPVLPKADADSLQNFPKSTTFKQDFRRFRRRSGRAVPVEVPEVEEVTRLEILQRTCHNATNDQYLWIRKFNRQRARETIGSQQWRAIHILDCSNRPGR